MVTQLRNKDLENQLTSIKDGYRSLEELLYSKADTSRHTDLRKSILKRIGMLNTFLAGYITNNEKYNKVYDDWVKEITRDKDEFMNYTRQTLEACYPDFITYLENHDLTDFEIKIVCLYAIGLSTNEVGYYIKKGGYRNVSSVIREKLGIKKEDDILAPTLGKLFKNSEPQTSYFQASFMSDDTFRFILLKIIYIATFQKAIFQYLIYTQIS